ncbi:MAG: hypothetical protein KJZ77_16475 [Anaerolineales bacterium]|nr:hypothetical protein [Anaerolineales bacterium]
MKKSLILFLIITLTACAAPQGVESTSTPEATGTTPPGTATPAPTATEDPLYTNLVLQLQTQVEGNSYLAKLQDLTGKDLPVECAEAAVQIAEEQQVDFQVTIDPFGDCRVVSKDGKQAIFPNDEGDLYVTEVGGRAFLEGINHPQANIAIIQFDNLSGSWYGEMVNPETGEVLAVATRDANRQWREMKNGQIVDEAGKPMIVPTATADVSGSELDETLDVRVADEATLNAIADKILAQKSKFPEGMPDFMNWKLIDFLNAKIGPRPIYYETGKSTFFLNRQTGKMEEVPGSYSENKDTIDRHSISTLIKVKKDSRTGLSSYVDEITGELVVIENSHGVDWAWRGENSLADGYAKLPGNTELGESVRDWVEGVDEERKKVIIHFVSTSDEPTVLQSFQSGVWFSRTSLEGFIVQADQNGDPLFGVKTFMPPEVAMTIGNPNTDKITKDLTRLDVYMQKPTEFKAGKIFFALVTPNQERIWESSFRGTMDDLENVVDIAETWKAIVNYEFTGESIFIPARTIWEVQIH